MSDYKIVEEESSIALNLIEHPLIDINHSEIEEDQFADCIPEEYINPGIWLQMNELIERLSSVFDLNVYKRILYYIKQYGIKEDLALNLSKTILRYIASYYDEFSTDEYEIIRECIHYCVCSDNMATNILCSLVAMSKHHIFYSEIVEKILSNECPYKIDTNAFGFISRCFKNCKNDEQYSFYYTICILLIKGIKKFDLTEIVNYDIFKLIQSLKLHDDKDIISLYYLLSQTEITQDSYDIIIQNTDLIRICKSYLDIFSRYNYNEKKITYDDTDMISNICFIVYKLVSKCNYNQNIIHAFIPYAEFFYEFQKTYYTKNDNACFNIDLILLSNIKSTNFNVPSIDVIFEMFDFIQSREYNKLIDALYTVITVDIESAFNCNTENLEKLEFYLSYIYDANFEARPKILQIFLTCLQNANFESIAYEIIINTKLHLNDEYNADDISNEIIYRIVDLIGEEKMFGDDLEELKYEINWLKIYKEYKTKMDFNE